MKGVSKTMSVSCRTREHATNVNPVQNSLSPISMTALLRVRPCALCIVIAHESLSGNCSLEHIPLVLDQDLRIGTIGTVPSDNVGPKYESNNTMTAVGRAGGAVF